LSWSRYIESRRKVGLLITKLYKRKDLRLKDLDLNFDSYLKEISALLSMDKKITHPIARKTFATTVLLFNNVPMEIVLELLVHSNMNVNQSRYGKVVQKKVPGAIHKFYKK
jgi:site-specific recombinase XerD